MCREKCKLVCAKARLINLMQFNVKMDRTGDHSVPWYENLWLSYYVICFFMILNSNHIQKILNSTAEAHSKVYCGIYYFEFDVQLSSF